MSIEGGAQLRALSRSLRAAGEDGKQLRRDTLRAIRETAKGPLTDELKKASTSRLPSRHGLAALAAKNLKVAARTKLTGSSAGVTVLVEVKDMDVTKLNAGKLRHPTYGHRPWVNQKIPAGIFDDAMKAVGGDVAKSIQAVVDDTARKIDGSV